MWGYIGLFVILKYKEISSLYYYLKNTKERNNYRILAYNQSKFSHPP